MRIEFNSLISLDNHPQWLIGTDATGENALVRPVDFVVDVAVHADPEFNVRTHASFEPGA